MGQVSGVPAPATILSIESASDFPYPWDSRLIEEQFGNSRLLLLELLYAATLLIDLRAVLDRGIQGSQLGVHPLRGEPEILGLQEKVNY